MKRFLASLFGTNKTSPIQRPSRMLEVECLEARNLMAASIMLVGTQLQIHGTENADIITVREVQQDRFGPTRIEATVLDTQTGAALVRSYIPYQVTSIWVDAHGGNDDVRNLTSSL